MKDFIKKYWEGALVAQIGLGYMLYDYFTEVEISSFGLGFFLIGNLILFGKLFYKNK